VKKSILVKIFLRSFFIHAALNFRRMQNLGFAMAIIPLIRELRLKEKDSESMLNRHLQMYNSHPYFSAPLIGSVVRLEEEQSGKTGLVDIPAFRQSLMSSYAAIGDTFFWGALRPLAGIIAAYLAFMGFIIAPIAFILIYTPAHFWIRIKGFIEGYKRGKQGIKFIRSMDLLRVSVKLRWLSLLTLTVLSIWLTYGWYWPFIEDTSGIIVKSAALASILPSFFLIKKGVSQIYIIYGAFVIFLLIISCRELFN